MQMQNWLEVIIRTLFSVIVLFFLTKLLGKRQISQLSFFEYITGITIGSLATYISLDIDSDWYLGVISLVVWVLISLSIEFLQIKSKKARDFIDSTATVLIKEGKVLEDNLKKERLTTDELLAQLRIRNVFRTADVEFAVMDPNGDINVMLKKEHRPITPADFGITFPTEQAPEAVIMDGIIMNDGLSNMKLSHEWLDNELKKLNVSVENVFLAQVDSKHQLYVDLYDDKIQLPNQLRQASLFAQISKCQSDMQKLEKMLADIKPLLTKQ